MSAIAGIIAGFLFSFVVLGFGFSHLVQRMFNAMTDIIDREVKKITDDFEKVAKSTLKLADIVATQQPVKGAARFYAMNLMRGVETQLFICQAQTLEEATMITTSKFGPGWIITAVVHIDAISDSTAIDPKPAIEQKPIKEYVPPKLDSFLSCLAYARDKFATTKTQKVTIESVINNIKKSYGGHKDSAA